eukprot:TRINITY_DN2450_c0_g3_i2.p1 TRINITY_DN2450_c0_g3~~TRINITY_DN2450_c0_g3_i2.p1  ORF type:complete len:305 (-),score=34.71 TRINITY_DN2450_c0_g3_i2:113-1027(-)
MTRFSVGASLGSLSPEAIARYLTEIDDLEGARQITQTGAGGQSWLRRKHAYESTGLVLGYIQPAQAGTGNVSPIISMSQLRGDKSLISQRIKITLDKFHVHAYPGNGVHTILCEFAGKNQVAGDAEELRFALRFKAGDNTGASILGAPIFLGLTVGPDGISFEGRTVNVESSTDERILETLDSPAFKSGLSLLTSAQPALKPLASMASAFVESTARRKKNMQVHSFNLGLDFGSGASSARLKIGSYVVVQTDDALSWDWSNFEWSSDALALRSKAPAERGIDFNYMVFGVASYKGSEKPRDPES